MLNHAENCAKNNSIARAECGSALLRYHHFLLLSEIDPCRDNGIVEQQAHFFERYRWAYRAPYSADALFSSIGSESDGCAVNAQDNVEFIAVYHWKKPSEYGDADGAASDAFSVEQTLAGITTRICFHDALIQQKLLLSDYDKVYAAVIPCGPHSYEGKMAISDDVYDALGDEPDSLRYQLAEELFCAPEVIQGLLFHSEVRYELARTLAFLASSPYVHNDISDADLAKAFLKANRSGREEADASSVPALLEALGFVSPGIGERRWFTEAFHMHRFLLSVLGICIGCSFWQLVEKQNDYEAIMDHIPGAIARERLPLMTRPDTAQKLLEPLLLIAEQHPEALSTEERAALFSYMMECEGQEQEDFAIRIADALLAENLLPEEANYFIEADPDEIPKPVWDRIRTGFRSSTKNPRFYYVFALRTICEDEPAFAVSLGQELALDTRPDLKVLGYAVLGTLAKAVLDRWDLPDVMPECITSEALVDDLFSLAAANHSAQGFYQIMLANLACAGFLRVAAGTVPAIQTLPRQYRDLWLSEGILSSIGFYPREFYCLDNFAPFQIQYEGTLYPTVEHAYQAQKFILTAPEIAEQIRTAASPHDAKKIASANREYCPPDWDERKLLLMEDLLRAKLEQHPYVRQKLLETGSIPIVEDSPKDTFWGCGYDRSGKNHLGKTWMKLRAELNAETPLQE